MFCDGQCIKKNKKCGLLCEVWLEDRRNGNKRKEEKCVFLALMDSSLRIEIGIDRLHTAENTTRNEAEKGLRGIKDIIGTGFVGMLKSVEKKQLKELE